MEPQKDTTKDAKTIKQKIRERYKGVSEDVLDVIPAAPHEDFYKSDIHKRVAAYCRVSTDDPNQTSSYELQKNHYEDFINSRANWELVDIYADEGISGTSLQHRDSFIRMIDDCRAGKIDMIVTKSVSRFARNIIDCIGYVRQLKAAEPPIGVYFETENIFTLDENSEMALSFIATLAQEESHTKSEIMKSSIEMRFKRGIFLTPVLLGYDHDEEGNLVINEDEANTVRLIFFSYLYGYSTGKIADALTELARLTKKGNQTWSASSVYEILTNERYCGDVLARKTFTPNYLNHKSKKNNHDRNQYRQKNHHAAIISREDFFAVQKMIRNAKYGNKGYFPEMHVVNDGLLRGFVTVHPKWAGFSEDDYYLASDSINEGVSCIPSKPLEVSVKKGDFDLRGYELVRSQFMTSFGKLSVTISSSTVSFNKVCIDKMPGIPKIELLVMPEKRLRAIRKAPAGSHYALTWSKNYYPKTISGSAFLPTLSKLFGWRKDSNDRITGTMYRSEEDTVIIYDVKDAILLIPEEILSDEPVTADIDSDLPRKKTKRIT
ncbi:MAG: recombinase family protein, partial [Lachnospiraceae bacterium]|nr:recombinase family protein [Lachnospiraceae bacterium]